MKVKGGLFITFEGGDRLGKTTQISLTYNYFKRIGFEVEMIYDPGTTEIGEMLRDIVKYNDDTHPTAEFFIFNAARAQMIHKVILPYLKQGKIILCDRFTDSTRVYQGYGRGWPENLIEIANFICCSEPNIEKSFQFKKCTPDLTFLFIGEPFGDADRSNFEKADKGFIDRVYKGYECLSKKKEKRYRIVNANESVLDISQYITGQIRDYIINEKEIVGDNGSGDDIDGN